MSERRLAHQYRVSHSTVRRAFNELVRDGLIYKEHGRGAFVAPFGEQAGPGEDCVVLLSRWTDTQDPYVYRLLGGLSQQAEDCGLSVEVISDFPPRTRDQMVLDLIEQLNPAALIVTFMSRSLSRLVRSKYSDLPIVATHGKYPMPGVSIVQIDYGFMGELAARVASENDCSDISLVCSIAETRERAEATARVLGVETLSTFNPSDMGHIEIANRLVKLMPSSVFFDDDKNAEFILKECKRIYPDFFQQAMVISHANFQGGKLPKAITRLEIDGYSFGQVLISTIDQIRKKKFPQNISIYLRPVVSDMDRL